MPPSPTTAFTVLAADGARITAYKAHPAGRPRAIVQIAHGRAEHAGR